MTINTWIFVLILIANVLGLLLYESRREIAVCKNKITEYEFREIERDRMEDDFKKRPVTAVIPRDAVEVLGQAIIHYLSQNLSGPIDIPIFPRKPEEPQQ